MTKRIFRAILSVSLAAVLVCMVLVAAMLHRHFEEQVFRELKSQAAYIVPGIEKEGTAYLERLPGPARITWVAAAGSVRYDSRETPADMDDHSGREEIRQALESGEGRSSRYSDTIAQRTLYYAIRMADGSVLRVSEAQYSVWVVMGSVLQLMVLVAAAVCVFAGVMASRAARQIVRPINGIDLTAPAADYHELEPLLERIRSQNQLIQRQMAQLSRRQEEFSAITENMSEGFLVVDNRSRILSYNGAALRLLEAEKPDEGESIYVLCREEAFHRCVEEALAGRQSELVLERDGFCRRVLANPVFQDSHLTGAVVVVLDTTEKEQREMLRREFAANVSHELKTPLTSILGTAEIVANGMVRPEDVPHFAGNIHREAGRLIGLVNDIIKLSRLDEGGPSADWQVCDLQAMAAEVLRQVESAAAEKRVTLSLSGGAARLRAVPQILEEIIYNLCENAVKYNREGGSVSVTVERRGDKSCISVADTGIGILAEAQSRVFERFYRVEKSHPTGGTGLGLSIVKHGAAYLGGTVELRSEVGKGSTFLLTFPAAEE